MIKDLDYTPFGLSDYPTRAGGQLSPRKWQQNAVDTFIEWTTKRQSGDSRSFVAAVSGGAGKTKFGAMIAAECERHCDIDHVVVIAPSNNIVKQWLDDLNALALSRDAVQWDGNYTGVSNLVTTYHMMSNNPERLARIIGSKTLLIFDECHHLADSAAWGNCARVISANAPYRLMPTATAFREDDARIPLVTYKNGILKTNYQYSYGDALDDGYVRPIYFRALDADANWKRDDKLSNAQLLANTSSQVDVQKALNAALEPNSKFMREMISMAHQQLTTIRNKPASANAAGIITCRDQNHARQIQRLLQKITKSNPVLAISDDKDSDDKIDKFRHADTEWLVVVRKASEGLDIPRLRIGVYATNITTELHFLQFLMRLIRKPEDEQNGKAYLYLPAHPKLIEYANNIRDMRVHALNEETESPISEKSPAEKGKSSETTPISAIPGSLLHIDINSDSSHLQKLIAIRHIAATAIDKVALHRPEHNNIYTWDAVQEIRTLLNIPSLEQATHQPPTKSDALSPAQQFEQQRQQRLFGIIFEQFQKMPDWNLDVLSFLWSNTGEKFSADEILRNVPNAAKRYFTTNKSESPLIKLGLIDHAAGEFYCTASEHLATICPNHDAETLVGYLLTGILPEEFKS